MHTYTISSADDCCSASGIMQYLLCERRELALPCIALCCVRVQTIAESCSDSCTIVLHCTDAAVRSSSRAIQRVGQRIKLARSQYLPFITRGGVALLTMYARGAGELPMFLQGRRQQQRVDGGQKQKRCSCCVTAACRVSVQQPGACSCRSLITHGHNALAELQMRAYGRFPATLQHSLVGWQAFSLLLDFLVLAVASGHTGLPPCSCNGGNARMSC
jgi:hypothetical protein